MSPTWRVTRIPSLVLRNTWHYLIIRRRKFWFPKFVLRCSYEPALRKGVTTALAYPLQFCLQDEIDWFNVENIIDDWVLLGFLVGNDFVPHLPDLHISHSALPLLYRTYAEVLPSLDGEFGSISYSYFWVFRIMLYYDTEYWKKLHYSTKIVLVNLKTFQKYFSQKF